MQREGPLIIMEDGYLGKERHRQSMTPVMKMKIWESDLWKLEFLGLRDKVKEQRGLKTVMKLPWQEWTERKREKEGGIWIWWQDADEKQPRS